MEATIVKLIAMIGTAALSLILGATALAYPQQEQHDQQEEQKDNPAHPEEKKAAPEKQEAQQHPQEAKPEKQAQHAAGGRIPADRYKANFGRQHTFRVSQGDYGNRRFQYGGYWFGFAGAWPSNWLYTQDVFVVEIDGVYYLCNPTYPGVNVALNVTL